MCLDRWGMSLWPQVTQKGVSSTNFNYRLGGLRFSGKTGFSGITEKVLAVTVIMNHDGRFLQPFKAKADLTFNQAFHCTCLWTVTPERVPHTPEDLMQSQGSLFSSYFWCQHQSQEWAKALVLGHRELDTRQPLQFPWETENIFPTLWMRKLKQREKRPRFFKEVKSQELWG